MKKRAIIPARPKFNVDFNELVYADVILLSQTDWRKDVLGTLVLLTEGLQIDITEPDFDERGQRDDLVARGYVTHLVVPGYEHVKWCCKIDSKGVRHQSDDCE